MKTNRSLKLLLALAAVTTGLASTGQAQLANPTAAQPVYQGVPNNATIPRIVPELCSPRPLQENVSTNLRELRITFDQPMDTALFYWELPTNSADLPIITGGPFWTNNNRTVVLPVSLVQGRIYSIPINTPNLIFRGATGLYVNPGIFRFSTSNGTQGSAVLPTGPRLQPRGPRAAQGSNRPVLGTPNPAFVQQGGAGVQRTPVPSVIQGGSVPQSAGNVAATPSSGVKVVPKSSNNAGPRLR